MKRTSAGVGLIVAGGIVLGASSLLTWSAQASETGAKAAATSEVKADAKAEAGAKADAKADAKAVVTGRPDPAAIAQWCSAEQAETVELARELQLRAVSLKEQEETLAARTVALEQAEARLKSRVEELKGLRKDMESLLSKTDDAHTERVKQLVKMVEANRPSAVAGMMTALETELAVEVVDEMNPQKAGKLLAALPAAKAAEISARLTRPLPAAP